ncbi:MAG: hypothetical protein RL497_2979 [Pseudomonadota bacterium]
MSKWASLAFYACVSTEVSSFMPVPTINGDSKCLYRIALAAVSSQPLLAVAVIGTGPCRPRRSTLCAPVTVLLH